MKLPATHQQKTRELHLLTRLLEEGSTPLPPFRIMHVLELVHDRRALFQTFASQVLLPLTSAVAAGRSSSVLVRPFSAVHLTRLVTAAAQNGDVDLVLTIYETLVRPTLGLRDAPPLVEAAAGPRTRRPQAAASDAPTDSKPPQSAILTTMGTVVRTLLEQGKKPLALVVYADIWRLLDTHPEAHLYAASRSYGFHFASLPTTMLMNTLRAHRQHQEVVHLYSTLTVEMSAALRAWMSKLRRWELASSQTDEPPPPAPVFATATNDAFFQAVLASMFSCTHANQRRVLEHFMRVTLERNEMLRQLMTAAPLTADEASAQRQALEAKKEAYAQYQQATEAKKTQDKESDQSQTDTNATTTAATTTEDASAQRHPTDPEYRPTPVPSLDHLFSSRTDSAPVSEIAFDTALDADVSFNDASPSDEADGVTVHPASIARVSKFRLLRICVQMLLADWVRWHMQLAKAQERKVNYLPVICESEIRTVAGRSLAEAVSPLQFSLAVSPELTRPMLHTTIDGFLRFSAGARLSHRWMRILYNRSILSFAEPLEESQGERDERAAEGIDEIAALPRAESLGLNSTTWRLAFGVYLRFTAVYSHSLAAALDAPAHGPKMAHSPYIMLRHLLASKFAHSYTRALQTHPADAHTRAPRDLVGTELAWNDWYAFWRHIELLRGELASQLKTLDTTHHTADSQGFPTQAAFEVYSRLQQEYIDAATEEGLARGYIQLIDLRSDATNAPEDESADSSNGSRDGARRGPLPVSFTGASHAFVVHLPSSIFADKLTMRPELSDTINLAMRVLQNLIEQGRAPADGVALAFVSSWRVSDSASDEVKQVVARTFSGRECGLFEQATTNDEVELSTGVYQTPTISAHAWRSFITSETEAVMKDMYRMTPGTPDALPSSLRPALRSPHGHATRAFSLSLVPAYRVARWSSTGFVGFHVSSTLFPPNTSPALGHSWKQTNAHRPPPAHRLAALGITKEQPTYATSAFYFRDDSPFAFTHQHRSVFFHANLDLQSQAQEWSHILQMLKNQGDDVDAQASEGQQSE